MGLIEKRYGFTPVYYVFKLRNYEEGPTAPSFPESILPIDPLAKPRWSGLEDSACSDLFTWRKS